MNKDSDSDSDDDSSKKPDPVHSKALRKAGFTDAEMNKVAAAEAAAAAAEASAADGALVSQVRGAGEGAVPWRPRRASAAGGGRVCSTRGEARSGDRAQGVG